MSAVDAHVCAFCGKPGIKPMAKYHIACARKVDWVRAAGNQMRKNRRIIRRLRVCECGDRVVEMDGYIINAYSLNEYELQFLRVGSDVSYDPARHKRHRCRRGISR